MSEIFVGLPPSTKQAIAAFFRGQADEVQQRLVAKWIMEFTGVLDPPPVVAEGDARSFADGKRMVGIVLLKAGNMNFLQPIDEDTDG